MSGTSPNPPVPPAPPPPAPLNADADPAVDPAVDPVAADPAVGPAVVPAVDLPEDPPVQHVPTQAAGGLYTFMVNGQPTTDVNAVQNRISMLEQFQSETQEAARNAFVDQLASDKMILQPQVVGLKEYAQSLDEVQYAAWKKTWDGASALSVLQTHGPDGSSDPGGGSGASEKAANDLEIAREIVQQHKAGGMKKVALEATDSFKKLKAADPNVSFETL